MQRSELDWLIYNEPLTYAQLILSGNIEESLNSSLEHKLDDESKAPTNVLLLVGA